MQLVRTGARECIVAKLRPAKCRPARFHHQVAVRIRRLLRLELDQDGMVGIRLCLRDAERNQCRNDRRVGTILRHSIRRACSEPAELRKAHDGHCNGASRRAPQSGLQPNRDLHWIFFSLWEDRSPPIGTYSSVEMGLQLCDCIASAKINRTVNQDLTSVLVSPAPVAGHSYVPLLAILRSGAEYVVQCWRLPQYALHLAGIRAIYQPPSVNA
jgi:hypothetical protein